MQSKIRRVMKVGGFVLCFLFISVHGFSQGVRFIDETLDVGLIRETDSIQTVVFKYIQTDSLSVIKSVVPDCECIIVLPEKKKYKEGDTSEIVLQFDPNNRPGLLSKKVNVRLDKDSITLYLIGEILPKADVDLKLNFKNKIGCVLLAGNSLNFGSVTMEETFTKQLRFYNTCDSVVHIDHIALPEGLSVNEKKIAIKSNQFHSISYSFNTDNVSGVTMGYSEDQMELKIAGMNEQYVGVHKSILPKRDVNSLAKIAVIDNPHHFNAVNQGDTVEYVYHIQNIGSTELKLYDVKASCDCVSVSFDKDDIAPGATSQMKMIFNTANRTGKQRKYLYIISNARNHPYFKVELEGKVLEK